MGVPPLSTTAVPAVTRELGSFVQPFFNRLQITGYRLLPCWLCFSGPAPMSHSSQLLIRTALVLHLAGPEIGFVWRRSPGGRTSVRCRLTARATAFQPQMNADERRSCHCERSAATCTENCQLNGLPSKRTMSRAETPRRREDLPWSHHSSLIIHNSKGPPNSLFHQPPPSAGQHTRNIIPYRGPKINNNTKTRPKLHES